MWLLPQTFVFQYFSTTSEVLSSQYSIQLKETLINQTQLIQFLLRLVYSIIYYVASYPETFNNNSPFATREVQTNSNT